jgi:hypothetical protein
MKKFVFIGPDRSEKLARLRAKFPCAKIEVSEGHGIIFAEVSA